MHNMSEKLQCTHTRTHRKGRDTLRARRRFCVPNMHLRLLENDDARDAPMVFWETKNSGGSSSKGRHGSTDESKQLHLHVK